MSRSAGRLTKHETNGLIDISQIPKDRNDYPFILTCARILYRIQLKYFVKDGIKDSEINGIVIREINRIQQSSVSLSYSNPSYNSDAGILFDFGAQLAKAENPLEIMRNILSEKTRVRNRSGEASAVCRICKNLVKLIGDLQIAKKSSSNRCPFRHINFAVTDSLTSEDDVSSSFLGPPLPLLWLPTLTSREKVTHRKTSVYALRKRKGFTSNGKFRHRLLRMHNVHMITGNPCAHNTNSSDLRIEKSQGQSLQLPSINNVLRNTLASSAFTRILPNKFTLSHYESTIHCCNHSLRKDLRKLCPCVTINTPRE
ncbi:1418_t:CDS:1 [Ambispora leptoticha]|uniref:1418_t:CDS:1 n=1 Tax=Ambispora leptoticha TaxID=144679 RepID=A0A9N9G5L5_9GLOM|nr:1418_t:CDS:1 [Ambispora leptoticha]